MTTELENLQCKLLDMLKWYHTVCVKYDLKYYIVGGTMLGAVRHGGFIPWDDDIDVAMPRKDYERLLQLSNVVETEEYLIEYPKTDNKDYSFLYAKMFNKTTTQIENTRNKIKRGIYIDIFPLDGIGENKEQALTNYIPIYKKIQLDAAITCGIRKERKFYKNFAVIIGRILSPLFIKERKLNKKIELMCKERDFEKSTYVGNLVGNWGNKEIMLREYFGKPTLIKFESIQVFGVEKPTEYLTTLYGDFMKYPPLSKQVSHHDYLLCDLNKSYMEE